MTSPRRGSVLPPGLRHGLWKSGVALEKLAARSAGAVGRLLPAWVAVPLVQGIQPIGKLDFPDRTIRITLTSVEEIGRLRACRKEPETVAWLRTFMDAQQVLYDIGANIGAYSFIADALGQGEALVYAFEPSFSTFASLSKNVLLNEAQERLVPLMFALSRETRVAALTFSSTVAGAALHSVGTEIDLEQSSLFIPSYRLDDLVRSLDLRLPTLMKLDVDGAELGVLEGSPRLLKSRQLRSLLVEVDETAESCTAIHRLLEGRGFHLESRHPHSSPGGVANHIFVRE